MALTREALRVYGRYQREIVEDLDLCPWASKARRDGAVAVRVVLGDEPSATRTLEAIESIARDGSVEIGLLLFPALGLARLAFEHFVAEVRAAHESAHPLGAAPFAMAAFHPDARDASRDAERLIPYLRRTPDPTLQLVRTSTLERVRSGAPDGTQFVDLDAVDPRELLASEAKVPLRQRIARTNLETIGRIGTASFDERIRSIHADRDETYAGLGLPRRRG